MVTWLRAGLFPLTIASSVGIGLVLGVTSVHIALLFLIAFPFMLAGVWLFFALESSRTESGRQRSRLTPSAEARR